MSKAAMATIETANNAICLLRFMSLSFRDLLFGGDTMDGAPHGHAADFIRGVIRLFKHGLAHQKKTESAFLLDYRGVRTPESWGPTDSDGLWRISQSEQHLKLTLQATRVIAYADPDLCRTELS